LFTGIGIYGAWHGKSNTWQVWVSCAAALLLIIIAAFLAWTEEHDGRIKAETQLHDRRPKFLFGLGALVWIYDARLDKTLFFLPGEIINQGEPSVTVGWSATATIGATTENMQMFHLLAPYVLNVGSESITITRDDLLNVKTLSTPIQRGGHCGGRLLVTLPGHRSAQVAALQIRMDVTCHDYLFTPYTAAYVPSPIPSGTLQFLPTENVQQIAQARPMLPGGGR
jgi:hypothetical protein